MTITRTRAMELLAAFRTDEAVITGPGGASGALWVQGHVSPTIYNMEMGYAAPMCLGVALAQPARHIIAVEGDGSLLAGCPALFTIGRAAPPNLTVFVIANGVYETIGRGSVAVTAVDGASLAGVAMASGIPATNVRVCEDEDQLQEALASTRNAPGPWVIVSHVRPVPPAPGVARPVPGLDVVESAVEFRRECRQATSSGAGRRGA